ncbi:MAG TPA: GNAT family N-acetyltransferase [Planctomycetaceae bacterium]|nr:GNAT family N-acetyltransferase [Planctomycetaceae bacterium]
MRREEARKTVQHDERESFEFAADRFVVSSTRRSALRTGLLSVVTMEFYSLAADELDDDRGLNWPPKLQRRAKDQCEQYLREGIAPLTLAGCEEGTVRGFVVFPEHRSAVVSCSWPVADSPEVFLKLAKGLLHAIRSEQLASIVTVLEDQSSSSRANRSPLDGFERLTTICRYQLDRPSREASFHTDRREGNLRIVSIDEAVTRTLLERTRQDSLDCPELHSFLSWDERLTEFRRLSPDHFRVEIATLDDANGPRGIAISSTDLERHECEVNYLGILPEQRGQGHGHRLLKRLTERHFEANTKRICVNVDSRNIYARRVYESTGFRLTGEFPLWISYWDSLF